MQLDVTIESMSMSREDFMSGMGIAAAVAVGLNGGIGIQYQRMDSEGGGGSAEGEGGGGSKKDDSGGGDDDDEDHDSAAAVAGSPITVIVQGNSEDLIHFFRSLTPPSDPPYHPKSIGALFGGAWKFLSTIATGVFGKLFYDWWRKGGL